MKRLFLIFLAFALPTISNAQLEEKNVLCFAIEQYVKSMYDTTSKQIVYIVVLHDKVQRHMEYGNISVCVLDDSKQKLIFRKAIKKTKGFYHTLSMKRFGTDTLDCVFCKCQVNKIGRYFQITMESGGDAGHIPFVRFVYNDKKRRWDYYFWQELLRKKCTNSVLIDG